VKYIFYYPIYFFRFYRRCFWFLFKKQIIISFFSHMTLFQNKNAIPLFISIFPQGKLLHKLFFTLFSFFHKYDYSLLFAHLLFPEPGRRGQAKLLGIADNVRLYDVGWRANRARTPCGWKCRRVRRHWNPGAAAKPTRSVN